MKRLTILFAFLSVVFGLQAQNPIISTWCTPDPAPYVHGDTVYLFTDLDKDTANYFRMPAWQLYSSTDMVNWTFRGWPMTTATFKWAKQGDNAWAAQAIERNGKWYWYVAAEDTTKHLHGVGVAVADHPDGPYKDPIGKPLVPGDWGYIDPSVFIDNDGSAWLFWGNNGLWYAQLNDDMISLKNPVTAVDVNDSTAFGPLVMKRDYALGKDVMKNGYEEAPWVYRRGNLYYLEYAAGGVPEHWAYSTSHSIHGPWTHRGRIMDEAPKSFTIHGGAITIGGRSFMFYHDGRLPWGAGFRRSTSVEEFRYQRDGSIPFIKFTDEGVKTPLKNLNPFERVEAETMASSSNLNPDKADGKNLIKTDTLPSWNANGTRNTHYIYGMTNGSWTRIRSVDLAGGAKQLVVTVRKVAKKTSVEFHLDSVNGPILSTVSLPKVSKSWKTVGAKCDASLKGVHDIYIVYKDGFDFDCWQVYK